MNAKKPSMTTKIDSAVMNVLDIKAAGCYKKIDKTHKIKGLGA